MALIPQFYIDSVVAIGQKTNDGVLWTGSGFFVALDESETDPVTAYLITNKHVVNDLDEICIRLTTTDGQILDHWESLVEGDYKTYSTHETADVIAKQINPLILTGDTSLLRTILLNDHSLSVEEMTNTGVSIGSIVYTLGFPMELVEEERKSPICRMGCISRTANERDYPMDFLIDAQAFPGNSGGPVFNRIENMAIQDTEYNNSTNLIGIVYSIISYREHLVSSQTNRVRSVHEENSGLTRVCPVDYIREVVQAEYKRQKQTHL